MQKKIIVMFQNILVYIPFKLYVQSSVQLLSIQSKDLFLATVDCLLVAITTLLLIMFSSIYLKYRHGC